MQILRLVGVITATAVLLFGAAACSDDEDGGEAEPTASAGGEPREITVVSSDTLVFDPDEITLTAGQPARILVDNTGSSLLHDLTIEGMEATDISSEGAEHEMDGTSMPDDHMGTEMPGDDHTDDGHGDLHVAADPGETGVLEFTPASTGEFVFYCQVEGHRDAGMEGTVTVE